MKVIIKTAHKRIVSCVRSLLGAKNVASRRLFGDDCIVYNSRGEVLSAKICGKWDDNARVVEIEAGASYVPCTNEVVLVVGDITKFVSTWTNLWSLGFQRIIF